MTEDANHALDLRMIRRTILTVGAAGALLVPSPAWASGSPSQGVHIDPGSPAGKEYQLPVAATRAQLGRGGSGHSQGGGQLFGAGINPNTSNSSSGGTSTPAPSQGTKAASSTPRRGAPGARLEHTSEHASGASNVATVPLTAGVQAALRTPTATDGGSGWIPLIIGGGLVLAIGGGGGFLVRRRLIRS
jgi:hypothetical protein